MSGLDHTPISNRGLTAQILCNVPLVNPQVFDSLVASIDSLRIKFEYSKTDYDHEHYQTFDTVTDILRRLDSIEYWNENHIETEVNQSNFKIGKYQFSITFRAGLGVSFTILAGRYCFDNAVKQIAPEIVLDVNPNKVPAPIWHSVARILLAKAHKVTLQRFDLALDLPINRDLLHLVSRRKSKYMKIESHEEQEIIKGDARTEYQGNRSKHGAIKLYDKGYEIRMQNIKAPVFDCSRLEITIAPQKYKNLTSLLPDIYSDAPLQLSAEFEELDFYAKAIILHPDLVPVLKKSVHRNTFMKYKKYAENIGKEALNLDQNIISSLEQLIKNTIAQYNSKTGIQKILFS